MRAGAGSTLGPPDDPAMAPAPRLAKRLEFAMEVHREGIAVLRMDGDGRLEIVAARADVAPDDRHGRRMRRDLERARVPGRHRAGKDLELGAIDHDAEHLLDLLMDRRAAGIAPLADGAVPRIDVDVAPGQ